MVRKNISLAESVVAFCWGVGWEYDPMPYQDSEATLRGDWSDLTPEQLANCVKDLRKGERDLRTFRLSIEARLPGSRTCEHCDEPVVGRSDRRYCSTRCRVRAHRAGD